MNAALVTTESFSAALVLRFLTGLSLAGVYPPAMKMASTWFRARRGLAIGTVVGALTIGKATPYLVHALPGAGVRPVVAGLARRTSPTALAVGDTGTVAHLLSGAALVARDADAAAARLLAGAALIARHADAIAAGLLARAALPVRHADAVAA